MDNLHTLIEQGRELERRTNPFHSTKSTVFTYIVLIIWGVGAGYAMTGALMIVTQWFLPGGEFRFLDLAAAVALSTPFLLLVGTGAELWRRVLKRRKSQ